MHDDNDETTNATWTLWGAVGAALAAAVCCVGPLVLISLGMTGAWVAWLGALEPYLLGMALLGAGTYGVHRTICHDGPSKSADGERCQHGCE